MKRTLTRSAPILDEADRFQKMLDWQLFTMEQESKLWGFHGVITWTPGDPLYEDPRTVADYSGFSCSCCPDPEEPLSGYYGHHVRPMFELRYDGSDLMMCKDCNVSWGYEEQSCWNCGKEYPKPVPLGLREFKPGNSISREPLFQVESLEISDEGMIAYLRSQLQEQLGAEWRERMNQQMNQFTIGMEMVGYAVRDAAQAMRGLTSHFSVYDEGAAYSIEPPSVYEHRSLHSGYIANPGRSAFEQPDVVGPVWGTAALYDPLGEPIGYARNRIQLPANWAELRNPIPVPNVPESRDFSALEDEVSWRRVNPPITERRRT